MSHSLRSGVIRNYDERQLLSLHAKSIRAVRLNGYIFFGSTLKILHAIQNHIMIPEGQDEAPPPERRSFHVSTTLNSLGGNNLSMGLPTRFMILDMTSVTGLDATAASSVFLVLQQICKMHGITLLFASLCPPVQRILVANGILDEDSCTSGGSTSTGGCGRVLGGEDLVALAPDAPTAVEWCEDEILREWHEVLQSRRPLSPDAPASEAVPSRLARYLNMGLEDFQSVAKYFKSMAVPDGDCVFYAGDEANALYVLESGAVELVLQAEDTNEEDDDWPVLVGDSAAGGSTIAGGRAIARYQNGGILGEMDFFLDTVRSFTARCTEDTKLFCLTKQQFSEMAAHDSAAALAFHAAIIKHMCLECQSGLTLFASGSV